VKEAARLLSSSDTLTQEIGLVVEPWVAEMNEMTLNTVNARLDEAPFAKAWEQARKLTADEAVAVALDSLE
jgi:hypothetical protein